MGTFEAGKNGYGLYDMAGNVSEWCYDWRPASGYVARGGNWANDAYFCRVGYRSFYGPNYGGYSSQGFRTALSLVEQ